MNNGADKSLPMIAESMTAAYKAGMQSEQRYFAEMLAPIFAAHARAEQDPVSVIPSYLTAAIVAARAKFEWKPDRG